MPRLIQLSTSVGLDHSERVSCPVNTVDHMFDAREHRGSLAFNCTMRVHPVRNYNQNAGANRRRTEDRTT